MLSRVAPGLKLDPWQAAAFVRTSTEYAQGVMAGSYGNCSIPVRGTGGVDSEVIAQGHYWYAADDKEGNMRHQTRDSYFVQYYSAAYNAFRYDEIFVFDPEYDTKVDGIEMFETSNMIDGVFSNVNLAPGIDSANISDLSPLQGGTVKATAPGSCITRAGMTLPSAHDLSDQTVSTYLGIVEFPQGFMSVGHVFDAYKVINRWPVPYADIIMYVDRTPGSPNYGFCTTWIIFQLDNTGGPGKNYWWDYSNVKYSGGDARRKFDMNPDYYFKLPKHLIDGCNTPGATVVVPIPPLGNMSKAWTPGQFGEPGWINATTRAVR